VRIRDLTVTEAEAQVLALLESLPASPASLHGAWYELLRGKVKSQEDTVTQCYTLVVAAQESAAQSPLLACFLDVLCGKAAFYALARCVALLKAARRVLGAAEMLRLPDCERGQLPRTDVAELLQRLFPAQSAEQVEEMMKRVDGAVTVRVADLSKVFARASDRKSAAGQAAYDRDGTPPRTLRDVALTQHLHGLRALRQQITVALALLKRRQVAAGGRARVPEVRSCLEAIPTLDARWCQTLVAFGLQAAGTDVLDDVAEIDIGQFADTILAAAPLRAARDFDAEAALSWVAALQASAAGTSSAAGLPECV